MFLASVKKYHRSIKKCRYILTVEKETRRLNEMVIDRRYIRVKDEGRSEREREK